MTVRICPNCNQRYVVDNNITDYVHQCNSGNLIKDEEDIVVVGNWEDDSGSRIVPPQQVLMQGLQNELQGTRAELDGQRKQAMTIRGKRASTHRQRKHLEFINLKKEGLD